MGALSSLKDRFRLLPQETVLDGFLLLCVVAKLVCLAIYCFITVQHILDGDTAVCQLLAQEIIKTHQYFPLTWNYENAELFVFNAHLLYLPFLLLGMKSGFTVHALGGLLNVFLIGTAALTLARVSRLSRFATLLLIFIALCGFSAPVASYIFGMCIYGVFFALFLFLSALAIHLLTPTDNEVKKWARSVPFWIYVAIIFLSHVQGVRGLLVYSGPLIVTLSIVAFTDRNRRTPALVLASITAIAAVAGLLSYTFVFAPRAGMPFHPGQAFTDIESVLPHLRYVFLGYLQFYRVIGEAGTKFLSAEGAMIFLRFVAVIALMIVLRRSAKVPFDKEKFGFPFRFFAAITWISLATSLYLCAVSRMFIDWGSCRYYLIPTLLTWLLIPFFIDHIKTSKFALKAIVVFFVVFFTLDSPYYLFSTYQGNVVTPRFKSPTRRLTEALHANGLEFGFANFWIASPITVFSKGEVTVAGATLDLEKQEITPYCYLNTKSYFDATYHPGKVFILFRQSELAHLNKPAWESKVGKPSEILSIEDSEVWIYPQNFKSMMAGCPK